MAGESGLVFLMGGSIVSDKPTLNMGRFAIDEVLLRSDPYALQGIFKYCVVVEAKSNFMAGRVEYTALSALFDPIAEGEVVPWYEMTLSVSDNGDELKAYRITAMS